MSALWLEETKEDEGIQFDQVLGVLSFVRDQRSKIALEFDQDESGISLKDITATLVKYGSRGVTLEVSALKDASDAWVGAGVSCYFRIRNLKHHGAEQLYHFFSRINIVHAQPGGSVQLVLEMPKSISCAQRRRGVRVDVDQGRVPVLKCWRELSSGVCVAGRTPLLNIETDAKRGLRLSNISACGLRLVVPHALLRKALPRQNKGEHFSFHFKAVASRSAASVWVNAALRNVFADQNKDESALGFEFVSEGALDQNMRIIWQPLKLEEVGSLGKLIFKWSLEACREKDFCEP